MISHRVIEANGIRIRIAEAGSGPVVLLCHGFPESWYSWRHQLRALAEAGYHAVAPDMRGYGGTDAPEAIDQYTMNHLVGDTIGVLDALGAKRANAARSYLVAKGVAATRISTISFGKDRPVALGSNDEAWSQNRNAITSVR